MAEHLLYSPLKISRPKSKDLPLNLNFYRNAHYQTLNQMKVKYKDIMTSQVNNLPKLSKIEIEYTLFPATRRLCDVSNVCCVVDKFFCDVLTTLGKLEEDNYNYLPKVSYQFGEVDKDNPRVEILIKEK